MNMTLKTLLVAPAVLAVSALGYTSDASAAERSVQIH